MTDLRFMEDVNNILCSGEVPNIFVIDEKIEIIENMRNLEKSLDKSQQTDGSGPGTQTDNTIIILLDNNDCYCYFSELFKLFVKRVKENLHIILAMSPLSDTFKSFIAKFPALMSCCTMNWMHQWPGKTLLDKSFTILLNCQIQMML